MCLMSYVETLEFFDFLFIKIEIYSNSFYFIDLLDYSISKSIEKPDIYDIGVANDFLLFYWIGLMALKNMF